jgi:hypothetical protein
MRAALQGTRSARSVELSKFQYDHDPGVLAAGAGAAQLATTANTSPWADWNAKREADRRLEGAFAKSTSRERVAAERLARSGVDE